MKPVDQFLPIKWSLLSVGAYPKVYTRIAIFGQALLAISLFLYLVKKIYDVGCKWMMETMQHYTWGINIHLYTTTKNNRIIIKIIQFMFSLLNSSRWKAINTHTRSDLNNNSQEIIVFHAHMVHLYLYILCEVKHLGIFVIQTINTLHSFKEFYTIFFFKKNFSQYRHT